LKFARDRDGYRRRLREAVMAVDLSLLTYNITRNHVHLVAYADDCNQVAVLMQQAAGECARDYNRRKQRRGAFWEGRYHATMVDCGEYLWECLNYVELNMVRCGVTRHPRDWAWSGYEELMGLRRRNRLLDIEKLLWLLRAKEVEEFRKHLEASLQERIARGQMKREAKWTESIAVGSQSFVERMDDSVRNRQQVEVIAEDGAWVLRESYGSILEG
jgi:putative transposase